MDAPPWRGYQWPHRDFMLTLRGAADTRVVVISLQDDPPEKSLRIAPGTSHGYHTSNTWHVVEQKRGSVLLMDGTLIHRGAGGPGRTIFSPFVPEKFRTPPNVVEPENVPDLMFFEPAVPEVGEAEEDCNYEANPRYCTFANSWSTPCREHSTCLYLCAVLLLRLVHET